MPRLPSMPERRAFGRRESCIRAVLHVAGRPCLHVLVRNYSEGGALLELPEPVATSAHVRLVIESHGLDLVCEVRHSRDPSMGVRFLTGVEVDNLTAPRDTVTAGPPAPLSGSELRRKLFGGDAEPEVNLVRRFSTPSGGFHRQS